MRLSDLTPVTIRNMMDVAGVDSRTGLRKSMNGRRIRWSRKGLVSAAELARCQREAEIIDILRTVNYGVNPALIRDFVDGEISQVCRDLAKLMREGIITLERVNLRNGMALITKLYWLGKR